MNKPTTKDELLEHLRTFAKHGAASLENTIRDFNLYVAEHVEPRARNRQEERAAYVAKRTADLEAEYWAAKRAAWADRAGKEYDAEKPPIEVPERVDLGIAKEIAASAKKGKAA